MRSMESIYQSRYWWFDHVAEREARLLIGRGGQYPEPWPVRPRNVILSGALVRIRE
jgi:hypothetical protein